MAVPPDTHQRIEELGPWFYEFDLGEWGRTASSLPPEVQPIHTTRLEMVNRAVDAYFPSGLAGVRCLDVGCHEGYYSVAMARKGACEVRGVDVREENLRKARFVAETLVLSNLSYERANCEDLSPETHGTYDLCLFLGLLYHLENPMAALRRVAAMTTGLCVVETQVVAEVEGAAEWGYREWTRPYHGVLALIDESGEFFASNAETGASPVATCPSPKALEFMLLQAGFRRVEFLEPPPGAYEQHARRQRVVCAARKG
ncbi:MAG TPA: methyltransferase domain-containing protein [Bryobacteraceae bacterium]|nr:methyltransferase domain-containing protein [Bryobacteraceae bacterium]